MKKLLIFMLTFVLTLGAFGCTVTPENSSSVNSSKQSSSSTSETPSSSITSSSSSSEKPSSSSQTSSSSSETPSSSSSQAPSSSSASSSVVPSSSSKESSSSSSEISSSSSSSVKPSSSSQASSSSSVKATCTGITLSGQKTSYAFAEDFTTDGLVVKATYSDGTSEVLSSSDYTIDNGGFNCMKVGDYNITVKYPKENKSKAFTVTVNPADKLKVLMIGNSFADDTIAHSHEVATALGIAPENILVADLYIGGCTLNTHWTNAQGNLPKYRFGLERDGWPDGGNGNTDFGVEWNEAWTIEQGIKYAKWDFITFQQGSGSSGLADTFVHLQELMDYVKGIATDTVNNPNANPNVKFVWHQTWAYANNSTNTGWNSYGGAGNQLKMYNLINDCVKSQVLPKEEFVAIIPNGTAVQNARTSMIGDNLTRDQYDHLTYNVGRYMTALNMVSILTGRDFTDISWAPGSEYSGGVSGIYKDICLESVKNAQANPFEITNSKHSVPDVSSMYVFNWQPTGNAYWYSSNDNYNTLITTVSNSPNFVASSVRFTKEDIPVGSIIEIAEGYQYRPDAWITDAKQTSRPGNYTTKYFEVTEDFWNGYLYRAFNVSKTDSSSLKGKYEEAANALKIYVPYQTNNSNSYYTEDKNLIPTIDNYDRLNWIPNNGYYSATSLPNLVTDDATNCPNYVATQIFTRQTLPIGSIIVVDNGYRYRAEGWESLAEKYTARGALITASSTSIILITEDWWANFNYRAINFGKSGVKANLDPYGTAQHFRIYIPKNGFNVLDLQLQDWSYWHSDSASGWATIKSGTSATGTAGKFVGSKVLFTKAELPVGSIITIAEGYGYRPDGYNANKDRNGTSGTSGLTRPANVTTSAILVTEEWWGGFTYRGFNIYQVDGTVLEEAELALAKQAIKIYVPSSVKFTALFKGEGTQANPYLIETAEDMWQLSYESFGRNYGKGLYFKLVNDITITGNWQPISFNDVKSGWPSAWYCFEGNFDGNGKTITYTLNNPTCYGMGLFAGVSGKVSNLTIKGELTVAGYSGGLTGKLYNGAIIDNVINYVNVTGTDNQLGGIAGNVVNSATVNITNCKNYGNITSTGKQFAAGIVGGGWSCTKISNCENYGNITGSTYVSGIVGEIHTSFAGAGVTNCTNSGIVKAGATTATTDNGSADLFVGNIIGKLN